MDLHNPFPLSSNQNQYKNWHPNQLLNRPASAQKRSKGRLQKKNSKKSDIVTKGR